MEFYVGIDLTKGNRIKVAKKVARVGIKVLPVAVLLLAQYIFTNQILGDGSIVAYKSTEQINNGITLFNYITVPLSLK